MSYLKLCQLLNQSETEVFYQEDADGNVIVNNIQSFPLTLQVEVIEWVSEEEFKKRGEIISFNSEEVVVDINKNDLSIIRKNVFDQLLTKYPLLNI